MNIHPLFVHLPIGILLLYIAFEILRFKFITSRPSYFEVKTILVIAGTLSAFVTSGTGDMAEDAVRQTNPEKLPLVEVHSTFAAATTIIFSMLAAAYLVEWCIRNQKLAFITRISVLRKLSRVVLKLSPYIAALGLIAITITGGLGASIVYGPDADPLVTIIYALFGKM